MTIKMASIVGENGVSFLKDIKAWPAGQTVDFFALKAPGAVSLKVDGKGKGLLKLDADKIPASEMTGALAFAKSNVQGWGASCNPDAVTIANGKADDKVSSFTLVSKDGDAFMIKDNSIVGKNIAKQALLIYSEEDLSITGDVGCGRTVNLQLERGWNNVVAGHDGLFTTAENMQELFYIGR